MNLAAHALSHARPKSAPVKPLREFHAKELHDGSIHTAAHDGMGGVKEGSSQKLSEVKAALMAHMGAPAGAAGGNADPGQCANCSDTDCPGCGA